MVIADNNIIIAAIRGNEMANQRIKIFFYQQLFFIASLLCHSLLPHTIWNHLLKRKWFVKTAKQGEG